MSHSVTLASNTSLEALSTPQLIQLVQELQQSQAALEAKRYIESRLAQTASLLRFRAEDNLESWAHRLLENLVQQTEGLHATCYVVAERQNPEAAAPEHVLRRAAAYAFDADNHEAEIELGRGLMGQAAKSGRAQMFVTEGEFAARSYTSLATVNPRALLIQPLVFNDEVLGAIELSSLRAFSEMEQALVSAVAEQVAANLLTITNQEKMRRLLDDSQQKANELAAQEEELRQNLEEMQAMQEHQLEMALELKSLLDSIDRSTAVIEFDLGGIIHKANANFLATMKYSLEEIVGQHHRMFVRPEYAQSEAYANFWRRLASGEYFAAEYERIDKHGNPVWISATYNPIYNQAGNVVKIVKFATDITARKLEEARTHELLINVQAQEEELRQNTEEMQAIQDNLQHTKDELDAQLQALDRSNAIIEFDVKGNILRANQNFLDIVKYSLEEIVGKHHRIFVLPEYTQTKDYANFWKRLEAGEFFVAECERVSKFGERFWLKASYNPIVDKTGRPVKVIKYATEITATKRQAILSEAYGQAT